MTQKEMINLKLQYIPIFNRIIETHIFRPIGNNRYAYMQVLYLLDKTHKFRVFTTLTEEARDKELQYLAMIGAKTV